jgi:MFS family permease
MSTITSLDVRSAGSATDQARGGILRSLHNRNYRLFTIGQTVSNTGSFMQQVTQDWLVLDLTHGSAAALGITTALQFVPRLLSVWGGLIADRYCKRRIQMVTQSVGGALALILGALVLTHAAAIWEVYALALALGLMTAVDTPAKQAFRAEIVGADALQNAVALNNAAWNLSLMAGPAFAGVVIATAGTAAAFLLNAASFGAVLITLTMLDPATMYPSRRVVRAHGQVREALGYVKARRSLWIPLVLTFFVSTFGMSVQLTNALMSRQVFHTGAGSFGLASVAFALGATGGALLAARRGRPSLALLVASGLALSVLKAITGLTPDYVSFLLVLVATGGVLLTFTIAASSVVQLGADAGMRGRVMGLYQIVYLGTVPVSAPLAGWAAQAFGPRLSMVAFGAVSAIATAVIAILLARGQVGCVRSYLRSVRWPLRRTVRPLPALVVRAA